MLGEAGAGSGRVRPVWSQVGEEGHHWWCQYCQWCLGKPGCLPISGPIFSRLALADVGGTLTSTVIKGLLEVIVGSE